MQGRLNIFTLVTVFAVDLLAASGDISLTWSSPMLPKLETNNTDNPLGRPVTPDEGSWIAALINIGAMIGPFPYSFIAEKMGRKIGLLSIALPHMVSYGLLAFADSIFWFYFARVLCGMALGGSYALLPMYISEIAEDSNRGRLSVTLNVFWTFGNLVPYVLGPYMTLRWFNLIVALIPVTFFVLFMIVAPETPYYLVSDNKIKEAKECLVFLTGQSEKIVQEDLDRIVLSVSKNKNRGYMDLFRSKSNQKALWISLILIIAQELSGINLALFYTQSIFEAAGVTDIPADISAIIIGLVLFISSLLTPFIADWAGRRILILLSCVGMALAHFSLGTYFYLLETSDSATIGAIFWLPITSLVFYIIMYNIGIGPLSWTVSSELFPPNVKSVAASLVSTTCWLTSFLTTKFFNDLNDGLRPFGTFWLFGGFCLLGFVFTYFCVPETKGKSFKEIQELLEK